MLRDLQHGLRVLMKNPGFTIIAVISIAIGVGANAAMFSVADGLVFRPLPVPRASEVVSILGQARDTGFGNRSLSYPDYQDLRDRSRVRQHRRLYLRDHQLHEPGERAGAAEGRDGGERQLLRRDGGASATRSCVACRRKRGPGRSPVVVLDYDEWRQQFAADPSIVNKRITLGGVEFTVVGVAPDNFTGIDHDVKPSFYIPIAMYMSVQTGVQPDLLSRATPASSPSRAVSPAA